MRGRVSWWTDSSGQGPSRRGQVSEEIGDTWTRRAEVGLRLQSVSTNTLERGRPKYKVILGEQVRGWVSEARGPRGLQLHGRGLGQGRIVIYVEFSLDRTLSSKKPFFFFTHLTSPSI